MNNKFGLTNDIYLDILDILKEFPNISEVKIFGSRARGDYSKNSDIDLAVKFEKEGNRLKLIDRLEEIRCILKFDVIDVDNTNNQLLLDNIARDGVVIYTHENR